MKEVLDSDMYKRKRVLIEFPEIGRAGEVSRRRESSPRRFFLCRQESQEGVTAGLLW